MADPTCIDFNEFPGIDSDCYVASFGFPAPEFLCNNSLDFDDYLPPLDLVSTSQSIPSIQSSSESPQTESGTSSQDPSSSFLSNFRSVPAELPAYDFNIFAPDLFDLEAKDLDWDRTVADSLGEFSPFLWNDDLLPEKSHLPEDQDQGCWSQYGSIRSTASASFHAQHEQDDEHLPEPSLISSAFDEESIFDARRSTLKLKTVDSLFSLHLSKGNKRLTTPEKHRCRWGDCQEVQHSLLDLR